MVCVAKSREHARHQTSRVSEPLIQRDLHWGFYGLNPVVRPYRGTDHIRAQKFMSLHVRRWAERDQAIFDVALAATTFMRSAGTSMRR
jgi:hypothetical protein